MSVELSLGLQDTLKSEISFTGDTEMVLLSTMENGKWHFKLQLILTRNLFTIHRTDLSGYPKCKHVCWKDVRPPYKDRPFGGDHCQSSTSPPICSGFAPSYQFPSTAGRNGSLKFRKWIR